MKTYLILLLKALLHRFLSLLSLTDLLQSFISDLLLQLLNSFKRISRRHQMVVVDQLDEWLHLASLGNSLLTHSSSDFAWVTLDSGYESMAERVYLGSFVVWFEDDGFTTSIAATSDKSNFAGFQDYIELVTELIG